MSYNVLSHSHWGLGAGSIFQGGGGVIEIPGGSEKRQSPDFRSSEVAISGLRQSALHGYLWCLRTLFRDCET